MKSNLGDYSQIEENIAFLHFQNNRMIIIKAAHSDEYI